MLTAQIKPKLPKSNKNFSRVVPKKIAQFQSNGIGVRERKLKVLKTTNKELQSANEELQSLNEELHAVNSELQVKIAEVTALNTDIDNLMKSTEIGTIFWTIIFASESSLRLLKNISR